MTTSPFGARYGMSDFEVLLRKLDLIVGFRIHEDQGRATIIEVLHGSLVDRNDFDVVTAVAGDFDDGAGADIPHFDLATIFLIAVLLSKISMT
jgi:hypothetical protein